MASAIFNVLYKIIGYIIGGFTAPLSLLLTNLFPSFTDLITNFTSSVNTFVGGGIAYFSSLLPPITKITILAYLGILLAYYTIAINVHILLKIVQVIKNVKIW